MRPDEEPPLLEQWEEDEDWPDPEAAPRRYSDGALAHAVQTRRNQNSWTGVHRRPRDDEGGDEEYEGRRTLRSKHVAPRAGWHARWSSPVLLGVAIFSIIAVTAWIVAASGGDDPAEPPAAAAEQPGDQAQPQPSTVVPQELALPSMMPLPVPSVSTKTVANPSPARTTAAAPAPPSPAQSQAPPPNPQLNGSGTANCAPDGENWIVTVSVSANLTGAPSGGTGGQGEATGGGSTKTFNLGGSGTSFNGGTTFDVGDDAPGTPPSGGSVAWEVTVTVAGFGSVEDGGSASYTCTAT